MSNSREHQDSIYGAGEAEEVGRRVRLPSRRRVAHLVQDGWDDALHGRETRLGGPPKLPSGLRDHVVGGDLIQGMSPDHELQRLEVHEQIATPERVELSIETRRVSRLSTRW